MEVELLITERPSASAQPPTAWPGLTALRITDAVREPIGIPSSVNGLLVVGVDTRSPAADAGLLPGDVLVEMAGSALESLADFYRILNAAPEGPIELRVNRQGREGSGSITK